MKNLILSMAWVGACQAASAASFPPQVENAHQEIWKRFMDPQSVMLDYNTLDRRVEIPTADDCLNDRPNALGWGTPIENGAMFGGFYLDALCDRYALTKDVQDKQKAQKVASGLLALASFPKAGFIGRGFAQDGKTPYALGSNDQSLPWFYGLWRYLESGIPDEAEKKAVEAKIVEVGEALQDSEWKMPTLHKTIAYRGSFNQINPTSAPRLLFVLKLLSKITRDGRWEQEYQKTLMEGAPGATRLELCEQGMKFEKASRQSWTGVEGVVALRALWEMETAPELKEKYRNGLVASALLGAEGISNYRKFQIADPLGDSLNWRSLNDSWQPQTKQAEAQKLAARQLADFREQQPQRRAEFQFVREACFSAWITTLCPAQQIVDRHKPGIMDMIRHYPYEKLYHSSFFPVENAYYRMTLNWYETAP